MERTASACADFESAARRGQRSRPRLFRTRPGSSHPTLTMKNPPYLLRGDKLLVLGLGLALFVMVSITNPPVSDTGAQQLQSVREMSQSGDWLIPTVGGSPQLQRTPIAQWCVLLVAATGLPDVTAARLVASATLAIVACMVASVAARVFGRRAGLLAGLMTLSTMSLLDFIGGAVNELMGSLSLLIAVIASLHHERLDIASPARLPRFPASLIAGRSVSLFLLAAALATAAFCNGLLNLSLMLLIPLGFYVLTSKQLALLRQSVWLWGAVAIIAAASVWPLLVWLRIPEVASLWSPGPLSDWLQHIDPDRLQHRAGRGLLTALNLSATWAICVPLGFYWLRHDALGTRRSPERLLWCYATLGPAIAVVLIEQPQSMLLSALVVWNVFAAVGLERTVAAGAIAIRNVLLQTRLRIPVPQLRVSPLMMGSAFACFLIAFAPLQWSDAFNVRSLSSMQLLTQTLRREAAHGDLVVVDMELGSDSTLALFSLPGRAVPVHNLAYLLDDQLPEADVLVVTRRDARGPLTCLGEVTEVMEVTDGEALSAFRVKLSPDLVRFKRNELRMSLAQSLHLVPGPFPLGMELSSQPERASTTPRTMIASGEDKLRQ